MIASLLMAITIAVPQSPLAAAMVFLTPATPHIQPHLRVIAQSSRYAIVQYEDAIVEGNRGAGQLLAEKFPFGWQLLDVSIDGEPFPECTLHQHAIPNIDVSALRRVLTKSTKTATAKRDCAADSGSTKDRGAPNEVAAVRELIARGTGRWLVSPVRVVERYAVAVMWGAGGREGFFKKTPAGWESIGGGGGAADLDDLVAFGIPKPIAVRLLKDL